MIQGNYQKLRVWQLAMNLANSTYDYCDALPKQELYGISSQLRRCAVSIPSNIAEGSQRTSDKEFGNFIRIAKGSLAELETQVLIALRRRYGNESIARKLLRESEQLSRMLSTLYARLTAHSP